MWVKAAIVCLLLCPFGNARPQGADYRIGPGDLLKISAFGYPELATEARVAQSGSITFPLIGEVAVSGLSTQDAENLISKRLTDGGFIPKAQMSILVTEYQSQKISVMGQVMKPGQYPQSQSNRVLNSLAEAGGLVTTSAGDRATLLRHDGSKADIDLAALFNGDPTQNLAVAAGDTIYVAKAAEFYIYGEIQKPGVYRLERGMTVSRAVSAGGGLTPRGTERNAVVKRRDATGDEKKMSLAGQDLLQADDVIRIRQSLF